MQTSEQIAGPVTREARAEWFLEQLEQSPIPVESLKAFVDRQYEAHRGREGDELAELLEEALAEAGRLEEAVDVLYLSARRASAVPAAAALRAAAERLLKADRDRLTFVEHTFAAGLDGVEALRRLLLLLRLRSGVLCLDKTWGFGVVDDVDFFYKRVRIDFRGKPGHEMSFDYAAETLALLAEDHLLARHHREPDAVAGLVQSDPGQVAEMALASFGPMPVVRLQETLVPDIVDDGQWKAFWDGARKALKANPRVAFPAKRSEPIVLHAEAPRKDAAWFERLRAERMLKQLVEDMEQVFDEAEPEVWPDNAAEVLADRLAFTLKGAEGRHPGLLARALMLAENSGLASARAEAETYIDHALRPAASETSAAYSPVRQYRM